MSTLPIVIVVAAIILGSVAPIASAQDVTYACECIGTSPSFAYCGNDATGGDYGQVRTGLTLPTVIESYGPDRVGNKATGWHCMVEGRYACVCNGTDTIYACGNNAAGADGGRVSSWLPLDTVLDRYGPNRIGDKETGWDCRLVWVDKGSAARPDGPPIVIRRPDLSPVPELNQTEQVVGDVDRVSISGEKIRITASCKDFERRPNRSVSIVLDPAGQLIVNVCARTDSGLDWQGRARIDNSSVLTQTAHDVQLPRKSPKNATKVQWVFQPRAEGKTAVSLRYGDRGTWTLDVDVHVVDLPDPFSGPYVAGVGGVSNPVMIPESKVDPIFPELARVARLEGNVILQAIVDASGTVTDVEVLRCNRPNMGFEQAAIDAVGRWRFEAARVVGRPVDVYTTIVVPFELH